MWRTFSNSFHLSTSWDQFSETPTFCGEVFPAAPRAVPQRAAQAEGGRVEGHAPSLGTRRQGSARRGWPRCRRLLPEPRAPRCQGQRDWLPLRLRVLHACLESLPAPLQGRWPVYFRTATDLWVSAQHLARACRTGGATHAPWLTAHLCRLPVCLLPVVTETPTEGPCVSGRRHSDKPRCPAGRCGVDSSCG